MLSICSEIVSVTQRSGSFVGVAVCVIGLVETASNVIARLRVSKEFFYNFCTTSSPGFSLSTLGTRCKISPSKESGSFRLPARSPAITARKTLHQNKVDSKRSFDFSRISQGIGQLLSPKSYLRWFPNTIKLNTLLSTFIMS